MEITDDYTVNFKSEIGIKIPIDEQEIVYVYNEETEKISRAIIYKHLILIEDIDN